MSGSMANDSAGGDDNSRPDPRAHESRDPAAGVFEPGELAIALSHYDLGVVHSIARFRRGSAATPKLLVTSDAGKFVLKRRADEQSDPARIRFSHRLQTVLAEAGFPLPHLVGTRNDKRTLLRLGGRSYELFRFLEGSKYTASEEHTRLAGYALAMFHERAATLDASDLPAVSTFHANPQTPYHLRDLDLPGHHHHELALRYEHAASAAQATGLGSWPTQTIHGDWHPGNMLFQGDRLAAVIDYDTARPGPRALDLAAAALQFSLTAGGPPERWTASIDESRFVALLAGYESHGAKHRRKPSAGLISRGELRALPHLMIESLIAEVAAPIVSTGRFGAHDATTMLEAVHRKAGWLADNAQRLAAILDEPDAPPPATPGPHTAGVSAGGT